MLKEYSYIFYSILFNVLGQLSIRWSMINYGRVNLSFEEKARIVGMIFRPFTLIGLLLYAISAIFWIAGLSRVELSRAYPLLGVGYALVFILSIYLFRESLTLYKLLGIVLIIGGAYFITR